MGFWSVYGFSVVLVLDIIYSNVLMILDCILEFNFRVELLGVLIRN